MNRVKNATIYFITSTDRLLLVQLKKNGKYTSPGGLIERNERPFTAALREFTEETGFRINPDKILCLHSVLLTHSRGEQTAYFFIKSTQRFPAYDRRRTDGETIGVIYKSLHGLKTDLKSSSRSRAYVSYFVKYTQQLFDMNLFYPY